MKSSEDGGPIAQSLAWHHNKGSVLFFLSLVSALLLWGISATDPDIGMVDYFSVISLGLILIFLAIGFIANTSWRIGLLIVLVFFPSLVILVLEPYFKYRDLRMISNIAMSDDTLLRYQYIPGSRANGEGPDGRPNNSLGLNDREYAIPKPQGVYRIVVLGDSVLNDGSFPNQEHFPKRLEAMLNANPVRDRKSGKRYAKVEVVNVSCEGYNTIQEVRLLERVGLKYEPDLVIVAYDLCNPFLQNGIYRRIGNSFFLFRCIIPLKYYLYDYFQYPFFSMFKTIHSGYNYALAVKSPLETLQLLSRIYKFQVVVAVVPLMVSFERHPFVAIYRQVADTATQLGFDSIVFLDWFKQESVNKYSNGANFTHPNSAGHRLMSQVLAEYVLKKHLLRAQTANRR